MLLESHKAHNNGHKAIAGSLCFERGIRMDISVVTTIASATISLLVPYLKKAGEKVGEKVGEAAWDKTRKLYDTVKAKFATKPDGAKVINALEKSPDDRDIQAAVRFHLKDMMIADESLARELAIILKEASEAGADTVFNTTISGNVQELIQTGNVYVIGMESNFLYQVWDKLEPDLQDALSMAYNQARRDGMNTIKTRYFFAALARLQPEPLPEFLGHIPRSALPKPIDEQVTTEQLLLSEDVDLSDCVEDSLRHLAPKATQDRKLTAADVFVDIARYGTGDSIARFRSHGVTPEKVRKIVDELKWDVIER